MSQLASIFALLSLLLTAWAQTVSIATCANGVWSSQYYFDTALNAPLWASQCENTGNYINYTWSPLGPRQVGYASQNYGARWVMNTLITQPGAFNFSYQSDAGVRIILDGVSRIDSFGSQQGVNGSFYIWLFGGAHVVTYEYQHFSSSLAQTFFSFLPLTASCGPSQFNMYFWNNYNLDNGGSSANPPIAATQMCPPAGNSINYDWGVLGPAGLPNTSNYEQFSGRFEGLFTFAKEGVYAFNGFVDDSFVIYLDGCQIWNQGWGLPGEVAGSETFQVFVTQGTHYIHIDWQEYTGTAVVSLNWALINDCANSNYAMFYAGNASTMLGSSGPPCGSTNYICLGTNNGTTAVIDQDWGTSGPLINGNVVTDYFYARVSGTLTIPLGGAVVEMLGLSDDGLQILMNGALTQFVSWQGATKLVNKYYVWVPQAGVSNFQIQYFEYQGFATLSCSLRVLCPLNIFSRDFYSNPTHLASLYTTATMVVLSPIIYSSCLLSSGIFLPYPDLNALAGVSGLDPNSFNVRQVAAIEFAAGVHTFTSQADDGFRFFIDNLMISSTWTSGVCANCGTPSAITVSLNAGVHVVDFDWYNLQGAAFESLAVTGGCYPQNPCQNGGLCTSTGSSSFTCTCSSGFFGAACTQTCSACAAVGVQSISAACGAIGTCSCYPNYMGPSCSTPLTCPVNSYLAIYYWTQSFIPQYMLYAECLNNVHGIINSNWGVSNPGKAGMTMVDNWGIVYSGLYLFNWNATYNFQIISDDGTILEVDGLQIWSQFGDPGGQIGQRMNASRSLTAGAHNVTLQYQEITGAAYISSFTMWPQDCGSDNSVVSYYAVSTTAPYSKTGSILFVECLIGNNFTFNWGMGSPDPLVPTDYFGAQFVGLYYFSAGYYTFVGGGDDGLSLVVGTTTVFSALTTSCGAGCGSANLTGNLQLSAAYYQLIVNFMDITEKAYFSVTWSNPCTSTPCRNGGTCLQTGFGSTAFTCTCTAFSSGNLCQTLCLNITGCSLPATCANTTYSRCLICDAGTYRVFGGSTAGDQCVLCQLGSYCPLGSTNQTVCPASYYCPNSTIQMVCPVGFFCPASVTAPLKCTLGNFCPEGSASPLPCQLGAWCPVGSAINANCPSGSYCSHPSTKLDCPANSYCPSGSFEPLSCFNTISNCSSYCAGGNAMPICLGCQPGYYLSADGLSCFSCSLGKYCLGSTIQVECGIPNCNPAGLCPTGSSTNQCVQCSTNYWLSLPYFCAPCLCFSAGSASLSCDATGKCTCKPSYSGDYCNIYLPTPSTTPEIMAIDDSLVMSANRIQIHSDLTLPNSSTINLMMNGTTMDVGAQLQKLQQQVSLMSASLGACISFPCQHSGACTNLFGGGFLCSCGGGFTGAFCERAV